MLFLWPNNSANLPIPVLPPPIHQFAVSSIEDTHAEINPPPVLT